MSDWRPQGLRFVLVTVESLPGYPADRARDAAAGHRLAKRGHEVFLVVGQCNYETPAVMLDALGVAAHPNLFPVVEPAIQLDARSGFRGVAARLGLLWLLRSLNDRGRSCLLIRSHENPPLIRFLLNASYLLRFPIVYEVPESQPHSTSAARDRLESRILARVDGVLVPHERAEKVLRSRYGVSVPVSVASAGQPGAAEETGKTWAARVDGFVRSILS